MTTNTFEQLQLAEFIQNAIKDLNFESPSEIQAEAIPAMMKGDDLIAMAPTGSGKTLAFAIPVLQKIDPSQKHIQALILCPTRELAIQAHREFEKLSKYNEEIKAVSIYGGQSIDKQLNALKRNPQIIIATPGRLMDHMRQKSLNISKIKTVVLDEADEMLDMGFRDDIHTILEQSDKERQTVLFSATMEKNIREIAKKFQKSPIIIDVLDNLQSAPDIDQSYIEVNEKDKPELITRLLNLHNLNLALVFCNTKTNVDKLVEVLKLRGISAESMHGDMNQSQREKVLMAFRKGVVKILVATDVAGRGIDVKNIEAVFNYDLPRDSEDYIHRIGRTARAGKSGMAFSLVTQSQVSTLKKIERLNGLKINKGTRPTVEEIDNARLNNYSNEIKKLISDSDLTEYKNKISAMVDENHSMLDIAAALYKKFMQKEEAKINRKVVFEETSFNYDEREGRNRTNRFGRKKSYGRNNSRSGKEFNVVTFNKKSSKHRSKVYS